MAMINWSALWNLSGAARNNPHRFHGYGAAEVETADQLTDRLGYWLTDGAARKATAEAGQKTVERLGGALKRTMGELEPYLLQLRLEHRSGDA